MINAPLFERSDTRVEAVPWSESFEALKPRRSVSSLRRNRPKFFLPWREERRISLSLSRRLSEADFIWPCVTELPEDPASSMRLVVGCWTRRDNSRGFLRDLINRWLVTVLRKEDFAISEFSRFNAVSLTMPFLS